METVTITIKNQPGLFLEADNVSPDAFAGKKAADIAALHAYEGREQFSLGKDFRNFPH
jgi:formylmethanofuran dehydrogenase subunit C